MFLHPLLVGLWLAQSSFGDREGVTQPLSDYAASSSGAAADNPAAQPYPAWFDEKASLRVRAKAVEIAPLAVLGASGETQLHGAVGIGRDGEPDWVPTPLKNGGSMSRAEQTAAHRGYCYNSARCASISLDRRMGDARSTQCRAKRYRVSGAALPLPSRGVGGGGGQQAASAMAASVVFIFHNEALCALLRSVHSVLNRTPPHLLREIVLIDDHSDLGTHPWLGARLRRHVRSLRSARVLLKRLPARGGLMTARTRGAEAASGAVVVFLDSHIEANHGWLEPLLQRISDSPKSVVVPSIDSIDPETFAQSAGGGLGVLGFTWRLGQTSVPRAPPADRTLPQPSPIMAGGLLALRRAWFFELGAYDPEMRLYGGCVRAPPPPPPPAALARSRARALAPCPLTRI